jgi:hypothetical protein
LVLHLRARWGKIAISGGLIRRQFGREGERLRCGRGFCRGGLFVKFAGWLGWREIGRGGLRGNGVRGWKLRSDSRRRFLQELELEWLVLFLFGIRVCGRFLAMPNQHFLGWAREFRNIPRVKIGHLRIAHRPDNRRKRPT